MKNPKTEEKKSSNNEKIIPEGSQLVKTVAELPIVPGGHKVFTGDVTIQQLSQPLPGMPVGSAVVTFEPGARSYWHIHPIGQVLYILEGEGRSGVYGKR